MGAFLISGGELNERYWGRVAQEVLCETFY
jgi:hypothetical protein